jgi:tripartite-type tricarboxylate transporter receptor subunit TctC
VTPGAVRSIRALALAMGASVAVFCPAADNFPVKPVRWLAPVLPGGAGDLIARVIAPKLGEIWGQPVVMDNRPGGGGTVGMGIAAKLPADGYTLVLGVSSYVVMAPGVYPKLAYDPVKDFAPVTQILSAPLVLVAHPSLPAANVKELIALARARPGAISYGTPGNGSAAHLSMEMFRSMSGTRLLHVPYRGAPPALADVIAGQITLYMGTVPSSLPLARAGRLKVLAMSGATRHRVIPDVPTVSESGLKGYEVTTWYGVLVPAGTSSSLISRIHGDLVRVLRLPDVEGRFVADAGEIVAGTPEAFGSFIARELAKWSKVARESGAKVE